MRSPPTPSKHSARSLASSKRSRAEPGATADMLRPEVIEGRSGRLLSIVHAPGAAPAAGAIVVAPPFAEEMNNARRMITLFAQAPAERGIVTVGPDLPGTDADDGKFLDR